MLLWPLQMTKLFVQGSEYFKDIFSANSTVSYSIVNPLKSSSILALRYCCVWWATSKRQRLQATACLASPVHTSSNRRLTPKPRPPSWQPLSSCSPVTLPSACSLSSSPSKEKQTKALRTCDKAYCSMPTITDPASVRHSSVRVVGGVCIIQRVRSIR